MHFHINFTQSGHKKSANTSLSFLGGGLVGGQEVKEEEVEEENEETAATSSPSVPSVPSVSGVL